MGGQSQQTFCFGPDSDLANDREIVVDLFAGGGGASLGISQALGVPPDVAVNHDDDAIAMHYANHPRTRHYCESVWNVDPIEATEGRPVGLLWTSPDCTHFSRARGGKPVKKHIRGLAWVTLRWAAAVKPRVIMLENVIEFEQWGPMTRKHGRSNHPQPRKDRRFATFKRWYNQLTDLEYDVDYRELVAADYGAPTTRKRLFLIARRDGQPIVWPKKTHVPAKSLRVFVRDDPRRQRTAADIVDFSLPCPSVFMSKSEAAEYTKRTSTRLIRPLAGNTMKRIANGLRKYVVENPSPFLIKVNHAYEQFRGQALDNPLQTITSKLGWGLVQPFITSSAYSKTTGRGKYIYGLEQPLRTITSTNDKVLIQPYVLRQFGQSIGSAIRSPVGTVTAGVNKTALIAPSLIQTGYGERKGQSPRSLDLTAPLGTVVAGGCKHAVITPYLSSYYAGIRGDGCRGRGMRSGVPTIPTENRFAVIYPWLVRNWGGMTGQTINSPYPTITTKGCQDTVATAFLQKMYGTCRHGVEMSEPVPTITGGGNHLAEVRVFLREYGMDSEIVIDGQPYEIVDIGMRMLTPRELYRAQGFPDTYRIDVGQNGKPLSKSAQVAKCGNSVPPPVVRALVESNLRLQTVSELEGNLMEVAS